MGPFIVARDNDFVTVTPDTSHPNVLYLDHDADTVLVQVDPNTYQVRRGRHHLGDVTFCNGSDNFGWKYRPRSFPSRVSRRWFPYPEAALVTRGIKVKRVFGLSSQTAMA